MSSENALSNRGGAAVSAIAYHEAGGSASGHGEAAQNLVEVPTITRTFPVRMYLVNADQQASQERMQLKVDVAPELRQSIKLACEAAG